MRFKSPHTLPDAEPDMTPMIDMAFQLIAFFMVLLNFGETLSDQTVRLPISELALPGEASKDYTLVLNMNEEGQIRHLGQLLEIADMERYLAAEQRLLSARREATGREDEATAIIRSDLACPSGKVQEVIQLCRKYGFGKFVLRAYQRED